MSDVVVRVRHLSKKYRIGLPGQRVDSVREAITGGAARLLSALSGRSKRERERESTFWALRDVSFDVRRGEVLGIIGSNGAGKSTLLKVLSRITEPTAGRVDAFGRVGSLLEVGTGFHNELTGRENIYLNGSILGMRKAEVDRKFDEIVEFAGVGRFLDTPVKRYSSGMYVRLAFAVAAHLDPEILIVDEVLSVGDAEFQRRCLNKMEGVAQSGRTVLLVSHNMAYVQALCHRALLLRDGEIVSSGSPSETVNAYLLGLERLSETEVTDRVDRAGVGQARIVRYHVETPGGHADSLATGRPARFTFEVDRWVPGLTCWFGIYDQLGQPVASFDSAVRSSRDEEEAGSRPMFICELDELFLLPGRYRINAALWTQELQDRVEGVGFLDVEEGVVGGRPVTGSSGSGSVLLPHRWRTPR